MRILFCGVRGSTPSPGREFCRVGGHTSCVAIASAGDDWRLVLDAGTGLRRLDARFGDRPFRGAIVLTHMHWDHMQGVPFFRSADRPDAEVGVYLPAQAGFAAGADAAELLAGSMSPPHFPIGPADLRGEWTFTALGTGTHTIAGFSVTAVAVPHKGGETFGYRVDNGASSCAYIPDHQPNAASAAQRHAMLEMVHGVDVLLHGGQFVESERETADKFGHATVGDAVEIAVRGACGRLVLLHHAPYRTDEQVADIVASAARGAPFPVGAACEEDVLEV